MTLIDLGSLVREILKGIPTLVKGIHTSYDTIVKMKDKVAARRDMAQLERVSDAFAKLIFEPNGIRALLHDYTESPKLRKTKAPLEMALNRSQELYLNALKSLNLSPAFKARHPELMEQLGTYHKAKGGLLTGMGNRINWRGDASELAELRGFEPLFDEVNAGIKQIQKDIKNCLVKFDRQPQKND